MSGTPKDLKEVGEVEGTTVFFSASEKKFFYKNPATGRFRKCATFKTVENRLTSKVGQILYSEPLDGVTVWLHGGGYGAHSANYRQVTMTGRIKVERYNYLVEVKSEGQKPYWARNHNMKLGPGEKLNELLTEYRSMDSKIRTLQHQMSQFNISNEIVINAKMERK